jgi:hypothetical protein
MPRIVSAALNCSKTSLTDAIESYILVTEQQSSVIIVVVAMMLWLSLLRSYTLITKASLYVSSKIAARGRSQNKGIALQPLSTSAHVAAITSRVLTGEPSPEQMDRRRDDFPRATRSYTLLP